MGKNSLYLALGDDGIRIEFPTASAARQAQEHIFLTGHFDGRTAGVIEYMEDDSVRDLLQTPGTPNAVSIVEDVIGRGWRRTILQMFDKYTITLEVKKSHVRVRYPVDAPLRLMLDDVLQAALHPILDTVNGFILHGACVVREKKAVVFMGTSGSGKSTSAFNLTRYGFQCYADDAVLLTVKKNGAWVWPLNREFSIRPLSFRLFQEQGIHIGSYTKDGEKYYFNQLCIADGAARLKYICFVEVGGESGTLISPLDSSMTLKTLLNEKRHFSFMARRRSSYYSKILTKNVPVAVKAVVGMDMDAQARAFERMVSGHFASSEEGGAGLKTLVGRSRKIEIIRSAWANPEGKFIESIVPFLGDSDPKIFSLALGFFQTLSVAQIEPVAPPSTAPLLSSHCNVPWLTVDQWHAGCQTLLREIGMEVIERFGYAWITSGPILYPMLRVAASNDHEKSAEIDSAWCRYQREKGKDGNAPTLELHVAGTPRDLSRCREEFGRLWNGFLSSHERPSGIYWWIHRSDPLVKAAMPDIMKMTGQNVRHVLIPVVDVDRGGISGAMEVAQFLIESGLRIKISRMTPLCCIGQEDADYIFSKDIFEGNGYQGEGEKLFFNWRHDDATPLDRCSSILDISVLAPGIRWDGQPLSQCQRCAVHALGLCRGGFVKK